MQRFSVYVEFRSTFGATLEVEAESPEQARAMALEQAQGDAQSAFEHLDSERHKIRNCAPIEPIFTGHTELT